MQVSFERFYIFKYFSGNEASYDIMIYIYINDASSDDKSIDAYFSSFGKDLSILKSIYI